MRQAWLAILYDIVQMLLRLTVYVACYNVSRMTDREIEIIRRVAAIIVESLPEDRTPIGKSFVWLGVQSVITSLDTFNALLAAMESAGKIKVTSDTVARAA